MVIREYLESDRAWAEAFIQVKVGGPLQARRGELIDVLALPGFVAERANRPVGFVTYRLDDAECELAFLAALRRHEGVGTALLQALLREVADCYRLKRCVSISGAASSCRRFALVPLMNRAVSSKPQISTVGDLGIPLGDEVDLELRR